MADAFQGARALAAAARQAETAIAVFLPEIPLWVPDEAKQQLNQLALNTLRLALAEVAGQVSDRARVDSGALAQSFTADPATPTGGIELLGVNLAAGEIGGRVFSSLPYAVVMNDGRRPGAPISREGIDALGLWAQRKLGLSAEEADRAKWAIANSIVAQGIEGDGFAEEGIKAAIPKVERMFQILGDQITAMLTGEGRA